MALNYPGPYEVRLFYSSLSRNHEQRLNCDVTNSPAIGTPFSSIQVMTRSGTPFALNSAVDAYINVLRPILSAADSDVVRAELWVYATESFDASYVTVYDIGLAGTSASAAVPAGQLIYTFRTIEGGFMRLSIMESISAIGVSQFAPYGAGVNKDYTDYVTGAANWILARDTSYPVANIALHPGSNEALFKKIYRAS